MLSAAGGFSGTGSAAPGFRSKGTVPSPISLRSPVSDDPPDGSALLPEELLPEELLPEELLPLDAGFVEVLLPEELLPLELLPEELLPEELPFLPGALTLTLLTAIISATIAAVSVLSQK